MKKMIKQILDESVNDKAIKLFQKIIDISLNEIKSICNDSENRDDIDTDVCNNIESLDKIKVININDINNVMMINVNIYIETIYASMDVEDIVYNIKYFVEDKTGVKVKITIDDVINIKQNRNW